MRTYTITLTEEQRARIACTLRERVQTINDLNDDLIMNCGVSVESGTIRESQARAAQLTADAEMIIAAAPDPTRVGLYYGWWDADSPPPSREPDWMGTLEDFLRDNPTEDGEEILASFAELGSFRVGGGAAGQFTLVPVEG